VSVHFRLRTLLGHQHMTQTELQVRSGLAYSTINDLFNNKPRRIELDTIDVLCRVLKCRVGDLLVYVPDSKSAGKP
jgi:putative transcriptional regulator